MLVRQLEYPFCHTVYIYVMYCVCNVFIFLTIDFISLLTKYNYTEHQNKERSITMVCGGYFEHFDHTRQTKTKIKTKIRRMLTNIISCETVLRQLTTTNLMAFVQRTAKHRFYD